MSKGEVTQQEILAQAAQVFSERGYAGTSMADLMRATGLSKGAIYNHFSSKDDLAVQSFNYAMAQVRERFRVCLQDRRNAIDRLLAVIDLFRSLVDEPLFIGACPILSLSIEVDDTHPELRDHARAAMSDWRFFITRTIEKGVERGEIRADVETETAATILMATLEGALMLTKLYADTRYTHRAADHLRHYLETELRPENN